MRAVAASMSIEEIFNNRKEFQGKVSEYVSGALHRFGCLLYNANARELKDENGYFETLGKKAQAAAISQAKVGALIFSA